MILNEIFKPKRLDELQGIRQHTAQDFQSKGDVVSYLQGKGFQLLGQPGQYGAVFDHPSFGGRYVLKVFSDPFYEHFLTWAATQNSPHLPRIVGKVMKMGDASMVRIERLEEMDEAYYERSGLEDLSFEIVDMTDGTAPPSIMRRLQAVANQGEFQTLLPVLLELTRIRPARCHIDLHAGNYMMRGKTVVINDPFAGGAIPFLGKRRPVLQRPRMAPPQP